MKTPEEFSSLRRLVAARKFLTGLIGLFLVAGCLMPMFAYAEQGGQLKPLFEYIARSEYEIQWQSSVKGFIHPQIPS